MCWNVVECIIPLGKHLLRWSIKCELCTGRVTLAIDLLRTTRWLIPATVWKLWTVETWGDIIVTVNALLHSCGCKPTGELLVWWRNHNLRCLQLTVLRVELVRKNKCYFSFSGLRNGGQPWDWYAFQWEDHCGIDSGSSLSDPGWYNLWKEVQSTRMYDL